MTTALEHVRYSCGIAGEEVANYVDQLQAENAELEKDLLKTKLDLLTSYGESEELLGRIAELTAEVERLSDAHVKACQANADSQAELAAEQLNNKLLRDALQEYIDEHEECQDADDWMAMMCSMEAHHTADEALSQPSDTFALDAYVAEKVKEAGKFDVWKTNPYTKVVETSIEQLTKQRDLAVEAFSDIARTAMMLDGLGIAQIICDKCNIAIKESEGK